MVKLDLKPLKRNKRKYSSYKGTVGKIADNYIINLIKNGVQILLNLILEEKNVIYHQ